MLDRIDVLLVKICGLKDELMLQAALDAGADFVGLVFFPKSPRHVELDEAEKLAEQVRAFNAAHAENHTKIVALVVNPEDEALRSLINRVKPDYLQLHGAESPERVKEISLKFDIPLIKAIGVAHSEDALRADEYECAEIILFDAKADPQISELPGGNGILFDWQALKGQKEQRNFMLSGGLNADNVAEAISLTGASFVDVSSGVESAPGVKDQQLIEAFIRAAKE